MDGRCCGGVHRIPGTVLGCRTHGVSYSWAGDSLSGDSLTGDPLTGDGLTGKPLTGYPVQAPPLRRPVLFDQFWADAVFLHWPVEPDAVAGLMPAGTRPEVWRDGATFVGLIH